MATIFALIAPQLVNDALAKEPLGQLAQRPAKLVPGT